jgi:uncharacterized SAM-binding protein YcdF (DUF218 family)
VERSVADRSRASANHTVFEGNEPAAAAGTTRRSRRGHYWLIGLGIGFAAFLVATAVLFVFPATDQPRHVDAILSLNGTDEAARESRAIMLAEKGFAPVLLFSQGNSPTPCPKVPRVKVVCFIAVPGRTVGEVRFAANYADRHGWHSLMVVPSRAQATRARLLLKRCFPGQVVVVPASFQLGRFPFEVIYEWAALAKALVVDRHC